MRESRTPRRRSSGSAQGTRASRIRRGEIRWADLGPTVGHEQSGRRPVLVLSHDLFNARSRTVIALAITSQPPRAGYPLTLAVPAGVLPKPSWVKISQASTLSVERLGASLGLIEERELAEIIEGLLELIG